jgi:hypothetical protein
VTPDIQDALKALNGQFGKDLYLAKSDTCMAAFKALKEATTTEQELSALGKYVREWIDRSAAAVRFWTPKYAAMADAAGFAGKDKWGWVKENVTEKLQRSCTGSAFPGSWGGPITTWEPLEWWIRNACNEALTFLILRDEPLILPQWLRTSTKPASDPIGYYRMILTAELGRELEWALDVAKIEAATSSTQSNLRISQEQITDVTGLNAIPGMDATASPDDARTPEGAAENGDYWLGQWADGLLQEARHVARLIRSNKPEDQIRSGFPRFFDEVIDKLYEEKKRRFLEDAQRRGLTSLDLLGLMAEVKGITGRTLSDYRKKYRKTRNSS